MPWFPSARRIPLPHYGYPKGEKGGNRPLAAVHHIASGYWHVLIDTAFWQTRNGGTGGSVHFAISYKGEVVQFVDTDDAAYGNGNVQRPTWPPVVLGNPNERTISIEHEGLTGETWTEPMYQASLALTDWIMRTHGLTPGRDTIIGHYRIDSVDRPNCPGKAWPIDRMLVALTNPPEEDEMTPEDRALLDWLKANKGALQTTALVNAGAGFVQANDSPNPTDAVSKAIRREERRVQKAMGAVAPNPTGPTATVDRFTYELSLEPPGAPPSSGAGDGGHA